jgi:hypothetical protein
MGDYDHEEARCCDLENSRPAPYLPNANAQNESLPYDHWSSKHK